jgi:hypothetical protein
MENWQVNQPHPVDGASQQPEQRQRKEVEEILRRLRSQPVQPSRL